MVVVNKLSETTHFIPMKSTYKTVEITNIFMKENFCLHGITKVVIFDRDVKFIHLLENSIFRIGYSDPI